MPRVREGQAARAWARQQGTQRGPVGGSWSYLPSLSVGIQQLSRREKPQDLDDPETNNQLTLSRDRVRDAGVISTLRMQPNFFPWNQKPIIESPT